MLNLRAARPEDEQLVLAWRNEASARAASFSTRKISHRRHHTWFTDRLADPDCVLLIVEEDGRPIGQVRLDRLNRDSAEISIGLSPDARGRGLGREALRRSVLEATRLLAVADIKAFVKQSNAASLAAFIAAGFRVVGEGDEAIELRYEVRASV